MKEYWEAHVTMLGEPAKIKPLVEECLWKFSCIDGDINLGDGVKCYATRQYRGDLSKEHIAFLLQVMAEHLSLDGIKILRRKVERVVYDDRTKGVCDGGCHECVS